VPSRSVKRRSGRTGSPRRRRGSGARAVVALVALTAVVALAVGMAAWWRSRQRGAPIELAGLVVQAAVRAGCPAAAVVVGERGHGAEPRQVTVNAPRAFDLNRFVLDVEAAAHDLGGRVEPRPLSERGGYGLARLEGEVAGEKWRVVVVGEKVGARGRAPRRAAPSGARGRLAIVLDDAGNSLAPLGDLERLPLAVAVAVLPNAAQAGEVARALAATGREVLVHMPMEASGDSEPGPGPGAIEVGLDALEVRRRLEQAFAVMPQARGLNNHMGSRATADAATMGMVMAVVAERGLYFLDSRTSADSVAERIARQSGVATLHRDVFLDVVQEPGAIARALDEAVAEAQESGSAVAIGHVHGVTVAVLAAELPKLADRVTLVAPSRLAAARKPGLGLYREGGDADDGGRR